MNSMTFAKDIISNWQPQHEQLFDKHILKLKHRLIDTGLFSRETLAKLIERCPTSELGIESMGYDLEKPERLYGELGGASGADAIAAINKGRMWMNIRRVMDWAPEYQVLLDKVFDEFEARMPNFKTTKRNLGILISSPNAKVYYHADIQGQTLWQIEGSKSVFLFPRSDTFISPKSIEKILLRETTEDMPYSPWFEEFAQVRELHPGDMLTWPLYAPHRVQNHDCLNISVTMEHWTQAIWNSYAVQYGNGVLRRTVGLQNGSTEDHGLHVYPKAAAAFIWKKMGKQTKGDVVKHRAFRIDASSDTGRTNI